jgi:hypothetical protein
MTAQQNNQHEPIPISHEKRQELIEGHRRKRTQALEVQEIKGAATYELVRGEHDITMLATPVPCPLPGFEHITAYFRTGVPSKIRRSRPAWEPPLDLMDIEAKRDALQMHTPEYRKLDAIHHEKLEAYRTELNKDLAHWAAQFVKGIVGWDFTIGTKKVPVPDHEHPETFEILTEEFESFLDWLVNAGYQAALVKSSLN